MKEIKKKYLLILVLLASTFSLKSYAEEKDYTFMCNTNAYFGKHHTSVNHSFLIDLASIPEPVFCGNSSAECYNAGYREYIQCNNQGKNCYNHSVLTTQHCLKVGGRFINKTFETRVGIVRGVGYV